MLEPFCQSILEVDLDALKHNFSVLQGKCNCSAVVKADAYGLGVVPVTKALSSIGCNFFWVATLEEAVTVRAVSPLATVAVFSQLWDQEAFRYAKQLQLLPVLNRIEEVELAEPDMPVIVHIDTGMNRLGIAYKDIDKYRPRIAKLNLFHIMSHLVSSQVPDDEINGQQLNKFNRVRELFPNVKASLANSSGVFLGEDYHADLARCGSAMYGINPTPYHEDNPMKCVANLYGKIVQIHSVEQGQTIGYCGTYTAPSERVVATVSLGYADGYLRESSNKAKAYVSGKIVDVVGRVSMDTVILDVTNAKDSVAPGGWVEFFGQHIPIDEYASLCGTIGYECLTRVGLRVQRVYHGSQE
tara:strand:- start:1470 stop:2537 length:1068 start_codon:yes stop_codon:yes gene_type:complete